MHINTLLNYHLKALIISAHCRVGIKLLHLYSCTATIIIIQVLVVLKYSYDYYTLLLVRVLEYYEYLKLRVAVAQVAQVLAGYKKAHSFVFKSTILEA
jgi:hypothetical protein